MGIMCNFRTPARRGAVGIPRIAAWVVRLTTATRMATGRVTAASPAERLIHLVVVNLTVGLSDWSAFPELICCASCYSRFLHCAFVPQCNIIRRVLPYIFCWSMHSLEWI